MATTLKRTYAEVRDRETAHHGEVRWPQTWWPAGARSSYCVGWQTIQLGLRTGAESAAYLDAHPHLISIAAFRAHFQWREIPPGKIAPGDLVISNWTGTRLDGELEAEHMEWDYSAAHTSLVIVGANTGPAAGQPTPNGIWKKARPLDEHILFGIRPPYRVEHPSRARRHVVQVVAELVNRTVPEGLARTTAAGPGPDTGLEGHNYRVLVQMWGRLHGYYPSQFVIDGVFGPQSELVEAAAYRAATGKR